MPTALSDVRIARSFIGHTAVADVAQTAELDFDLGVQEAIEVFGVHGTFSPNLAFTTGTFTHIGLQTLHLEDDALTTVPHDDADADIFETDTEIVFQQEITAIAYNGTTEAAAAVNVNPSGLFMFVKPVLSAANMTHRTVANSVDLDMAATLFIHYRYVKLNSSELAFAIARRGR